MHILLVDDNRESCVALTEILKADGHAVDTVCDGLDALELMETRDFDAVVSDALMPRMDGFTLCRSIKSDDNLKNIPVIMLTGEYTDEGAAAFAKKIGASEVVKKTDNADNILAAIDRVQGFSKNHFDTRVFNVNLPEDEYLKGYNSLLFRRLEAKMTEVAQANKKLAERNVQLERERRKYRQLFLSANDGIMLVERATYAIVETNQHAKKILRLKERPALPGIPHEKKKLNDLKPFGDVLAEHVSRGEEIRLESTYIADGLRIHVDISGSRIGTEDDLYLVILRDITRRKEWLERFVAIDKLRALGRLSNGLIHEIRNPLNVISINLQFLKRGLPENSPERKFAVGGLEGVEAVDKVVREMMNFARPQAPSKSKLSLGRLLSEISSMAKTSLQKSGIALEIENGAEDDSVFADKSQVLHGLLNVVQNAIEAMPNGGRLYFKIKNLDDELSLQITDTGIGMDEEEAKLAVEPFHTTKEGATGMGLSISNRLFELNGASLLCQSKPGVGTTITVFFHRGG